MPEPASFSLASALALVFGTPPFGGEYTTDHIRKVLGKLLGQALTEEAVLEQLRAAAYATPRPGSGKHLLKWRFSRAELPAGSGSRPAPSVRAKRPPRPPRQERSIAESAKLKR